MPENRIEIYDESHSINEDRFITIGLTDEILRRTSHNTRQCDRYPCSLWYWDGVHP